MRTTLLCTATANDPRGCATITAQKSGTVSRLAVNRIQQVEGGDLLVQLG
ncbi:hypothetical protein AB0G20_21755 [Streptomyces sp. NPDC024017]